jgi:hypothetical protein
MQTNATHPVTGYKWAMPHGLDWDGPNVTCQTDTPGRPFMENPEQRLLD